MSEDAPSWLDIAVVLGNVLLALITLGLVTGLCIGAMHL